jgi:hypothetical protein
MYHCFADATQYNQNWHFYFLGLIFFFLLLWTTHKSLKKSFFFTYIHYLKIKHKSIHWFVFSNVFEFSKEILFLISLWTVYVDFVQNHCQYYCMTLVWARACVYVCVCVCWCRGGVCKSRYEVVTVVTVQLFPFWPTLLPLLCVFPLPEDERAL